MENEELEIYCKECGSCGEEGCCPPTICQNKKDGLYCKGSISTLKDTYLVLREYQEYLYKTNDKDHLDILYEIESRIRYR